MPPRTSRYRFISHRMGMIGYRVAKVGKDVVNIILNPFDRARLREHGADLTLLENIGGRRARKVMIRVLRSVE